MKFRVFWNIQINSPCPRGQHKEHLLRQDVFQDGKIRIVKKMAWQYMDFSLSTLFSAIPTIRKIYRIRTNSLLLIIPKQLLHPLPRIPAGRKYVQKIRFLRYGIVHPMHKFLSFKPTDRETAGFGKL